MNIQQSLENMVRLKDIKGLTMELNTKDIKRRIYVINALGRTKDPRAVQILMKALMYGKYGVQEQAVKSLALIGNKDSIIVLIKNFHGTSGKTCLNAIVKIGKPAVPYLIKAINTKNLFLSIKAIEALVPNK